MKRLRKLVILTILLPTLLLCSCLKLPSSIGQNPQNTPAAAASVPTGAPPSSIPSAAVASPAPTDWHSGVKTDYSGLTPYQPLEEKYTRLSAGALPVLKPSGSYGKLLPYVGETFYGEFDYNTFSRYGLVTKDAVIVTDPVYTNVYQGSYYNYGDYTSIYVPAYDLEQLSDKIDKDNPWDSVRHAVCALDGSWSTTFDYAGVFFADNIIMCIRDSEKNDIDILDYSGKLLYNTTSLGCYKDIPPQSAYIFESGYGEGLIAVPLSTGKTVYIDAQTGVQTMTDYKLGEAFFGGYARVRENENGLIGFINKDFELVIKPQYLYADIFYHGKNVVQFEDNSYAVIDEAGNILFENQYIVSRWDAATYGVYDADNNVRYYDGSFKEITAGGAPVTPLYDGWFYYSTNRSTVLMKGSEKYTLDGITQISTVAGGLVVYYENGKDTWSEGIKTLDGKTVVPLTENISPSIVTSKSTGEVFIIMSYYTPDGSYQTFAIMTADGKTIISGKGYAIYDDVNNLFELDDMQSYGYIDTAGNYLFRISLLRYLPD